jgi:hypothetical protein
VVGIDPGIDGRSTPAGIGPATKAVPVRERAGAAWALGTETGRLGGVSSSPAQARYVVRPSTRWPSTWPICVWPICVCRRRHGANEPSAAETVAGLLPTTVRMFLGPDGAAPFPGAVLRMNGRQTPPIKNARLEA